MFLTKTLFPTIEDKLIFILVHFKQNLTLVCVTVRVHQVGDVAKDEEVNHIALKTKLYIQADKVTVAALHKLLPVRLVA